MGMPSRIDWEHGALPVPTPSQRHSTRDPNPWTTASASGLGPRGFLSTSARTSAISPTPQVPSYKRGIVMWPNSSWTSRISQVRFVKQPVEVQHSAVGSTSVNKDFNIQYEFFLLLLIAWGLHSTHSQLLRATITITTGPRIPFRFTMYTRHSEQFAIDWAMPVQASVILHLSLCT